MTGLEELLTLDQAAALVPGATSGTLSRRIRQGKLRATRPGKAYLTTRAAVLDMIEACRVVPKVQGCGSGPLAPPTVAPLLGSSSTDLANAALDSMLGPAKMRNQKLSKHI